jgi:hypothetical protein
MEMLRRQSIQITQTPSFWVGDKYNIVTYIQPSAHLTPVSGALCYVGHNSNALVAIGVMSSLVKVEFR